MAMRKLEDREPEAGRSGPAAKAVLRIAEASGETRGVALVLHGGRADSYDPVRGRHLSPARMRPFARALHRQGGRHGLAVWTLRNRYRGWNGKDMSPVQDARWALSRISQEHPGVPVYLLGHSMGGLTALCVADDRASRGRRRARPVAQSRNPGGTRRRPPGPDRARHRGPLDQPGELTGLCPAGRGRRRFRRLRLPQGHRALHVPPGGPVELAGERLRPGCLRRGQGADVSGAAPSALRGPLPAAGTRMPVVL